MRRLKLEKSSAGLAVLYESSGKQTRLIEGVFYQGEVLGAHIHTSGEDCAFVLSGTLTYYISNSETIPVLPGEAVFGWKNVLHGYANEHMEPVHLMIFGTPRNTGLGYPSDSDPRVRVLPVEERKIAFGSERTAAESEFSSFSYVTVEGEYSEPLEAGVLKAFIDWENKELFVFDGDAVLLQTLAPRTFLRYTAQS
jgi:quercetin dioxygenase-like cupin family protein